MNWASTSRRWPRSTAFTLIELLVTVTIIAVLAALLLPALAGAKRASQRTKCLSGIKQWGLAFLSYTYDNDNWIPREGYHTNGVVVRNTWAEVNDARAADAWYNALPPLAGVRTAASYSAPWDRKRFYDASSLFHCPAAKFTSPTRQVTFALFSVGMNSQLIEAPHYPSVHMQVVQQDNNTVLFADTLLEDEPRFVDEQAWTNLGQPSTTANRFAALRHARGGNIGFVDGRVEWRRGADVVQTVGPLRGGTIRPQTNIVWDVHDQ